MTPRGLVRSLAWLVASGIVAACVAGAEPPRSAPPPAAAARPEPSAAAVGSTSSAPAASASAPAPSPRRGTYGGPCDRRSDCPSDGGCHDGRCVQYPL